MKNFVIIGIRLILLILMVGVGNNRSVFAASQKEKSTSPIALRTVIDQLGRTVVIPEHVQEVARSIAGVDHRQLIPSAFLLGGGFIRFAVKPLPLGLGI
jgi:ABC-type Fe3+-hydroxamate transport system substrate-binding protein